MGYPCPGPCFPAAFLLPRVASTAAAGLGASPPDAHSRRHGPTAGQRGRSPAAKAALAAAPWKGPGVKRRFGSSARDFSTWDDISPGLPASRAFFFWFFVFFLHPSFPYFQDFSCINSTPDRFLFTVGINLHLLGEALSEFPPAFLLGGLGCPVIYALSPPRLGADFSRALRSFR